MAVELAGRRRWTPVASDQNRSGASPGVMGDRSRKSLQIAGSEAARKDGRKKDGVRGRRLEVGTSTDCWTSSGRSRTTRFVFSLDNHSGPQHTEPNAY